MNKDIIKKIKGQALSVLVALFLFFTFTFLQIFATEQGLNVGQKVLEGVASVYFFNDIDRQIVTSPQVHFDVIPFSGNAQESEGVLGVAGSLLRIENATDYRSLEVNIAPSLEDTGVFMDDANWKSASDSYPTYSSLPENGVLEVLLSSANVYYVSGECEEGSFEFASDASFLFVDGGDPDFNVESVDLLRSAGSVDNCLIDVGGIILKQTIPSFQSWGIYSLNMVITISALSNAEPPTGLAAAPYAGSSKSIKLEWDDPGDPSVLGYRIQQRENGGLWTTPVGDTGPGVYELVFEGLTSGRLYEYRIAAIYPEGFGPYSLPSLPVECSG